MNSNIINLNVKLITIIVNLDIIINVKMEKMGKWENGKDGCIGERGERGKRWKKR